MRLKDRNDKAPVPDGTGALVGVGLRSQHYPVITEKWPAIDWFEAISENYMDTGGRPLQVLEKIRERYPLALHGTSLSIGSTDPLDPHYLARLKALIQRIEPFIVSDHLSWSGVGGEALFDLLPLPFTEEAIRHIVRRVQQVQELIGRKILLENVSTYVTYRHSTIPEWEFLTEVSRRSGCGILLDLNNLYVNSFNHRFDPMEYLRHIPGEQVGQFHLAGHTDHGKFLFDTHSDHVISPVWKLYEEALKLRRPIPTLIEWDEAIPAFEVLAKEAEKARVIARRQTQQGRSNPAGASQRYQVPLVLQKVPGTYKARPAPSLKETERWIKSRIKIWKRKSGPEKTLLNPQGGDPGVERMSVYSKGYLARVRETLLEVYESVRQVLGHKRFDEIGAAYAKRYSRSNYNLNYAGSQFGEFLKFHSWTKALPFLPDLARLEWTIWEAFHAFDQAPLTPARMASVTPKDWENVQLEFQPSVRFLVSRWPVLDIWLERDNPEGKVEEKNRILKTQRVLIGRKVDLVRCERIDENQYRLLEGLLAGRTLGSVCEKLAETSKEDNLPVSDWFARWIQDGLIQNFKLKTDLPHSA